MKDIIKGVVYDRGLRTANGEAKYFSLVAMIIASDKPLVTEKTGAEFIVMGVANIAEEIQNLTKYECPYKMGDISSAIIDVSSMVPDGLEKI